MKKRNIVKSTREFTEIINTKNIISSKFVNIYFRNKIEEKNRYGISVPKKVGNAVIRNKIKRRVKSIIDKIPKSFEKENDCIIIVKKAILDSNFQEVEIELNKTLERLR